MCTSPAVSPLCGRWPNVCQVNRWVLWGDPSGDVHTTIPLHRRGFLWFTSLTLPSLLLQRYRLGFPPPGGEPFPLGSFQWLELGYLLELSLGLKENSGKAGHLQYCPVSSSSIIVSSSQPPFLRLLEGEAASISIFMYSPTLLETVVRILDSPKFSLMGQAPQILPLSKYPAGG